jgi:glycosyltransferase involved in cell wall biosynthesis
MCGNMVTLPTTPRDTVHDLPDGAETRPVKLSIVIPALNEEITIGKLVDWCKEGLEQAGVEGQILIVDSSTDRTAEIALAHGAEVLHVPKRGLGRAYIDALPYIRGQYVIMGDADLTYDLREIQPFVEKLEQGYEFVMGSRLTGTIEPGAMPPLHQYFGTPVTTWILNWIYGTHFSDIHCGMRAMTLNALRRINLESQAWEYASEMVLKAAKLNLRIAEVPIRFYKDTQGRVSHHKRSGWLSPWRAGWINLRVIFLYAPDFFLWKPGWMLFMLGVLLVISLAGGPYSLVGVGLNLHWMLLGLTLSTLGYSAIELAVLSRVFYNFNPRFTDSVYRWVTYNRGVWLGILLMLVGVGLNFILLINWISSGLQLTEFYHPGIFGLLLISLGFQTFTFTLLLQMMAGRLK